MKTVMEIVTVVFTLGAILLLWVIALPSIKKAVRWIGAFNSSYNKWKNDKHK